MADRQLIEQMEQMQMSSIYTKINQARKIVHGTQMNKSGHNKFAGYKYFELGDFLQPALKAFDEVGLCGLVSFDNEYATLTVVDINTQAEIKFTSPMGSANLKGCHEVQNIGAVQTYQRRYLWMAALELVEHDEIDAQTGADNNQAKQQKPATRTATKATTKATPKPLDMDSLYKAVMSSSSKEQLDKFKASVEERGTEEECTQFSEWYIEKAQTLVKQAEEIPA